MDIIKRILVAIVTVVLVGCFYITSADAASKTAKSTKTARPKARLSFTAGLNQLLTTAPENTHIGLSVESTKTGKVLYSYHADYLFTPASVQKIFVAVAAFAALKPSFVFSTRLLTNGKISHGELTGNLYVQFVGDPTLRTHDIADLFEQLKALGVNTIKGNVYIDNSAYDNQSYPAGWFWDDLSYAYAAPLNAIIINENQFTLSMTPAKKLNTPTLIKNSLPDGVATIDNQTKTTKRYQANCPLVIYSDPKNIYHVKGCVAQRVGKQYRRLAVRDPVPNAKALVEEYLTDNEIKFQGSVTLHAVPKLHHVLAKHDSKILYKIIKTMLKNSDNLITNSLLKKVGQVFYNAPGSWHNGIWGIRSLLGRPAGVNFKKLVITDGAGLSRYNLISPNELVKVLYYAFHQKRFITYFMNALPIAGVDGTLRWRMPKLAKGRRVHAKTGSMDGVCALAGYVNTINNGTLAFAIISNGFVDRHGRYRRFENKVVQYLVNAPRGS